LNAKQVFEKRQYQEDCLNVINNLPDGSRTIVCLATGLGKTYVFSRMNHTGKTLILSHRDELVRQPIRYISEPVGIEKADESPHGENIISASVQTLCRDSRLNKYPADYFDTIIIDEAHHASAKSYRKIIDHFNPKKLIGFTATPSRGDGARLDDIFDTICFSRDIRWGIRNNYLCNLKSFEVDTEIDLSCVKMTAGDYNIGELNDAIENSDAAECIGKAYKKNVEGTSRHCLIYCVSVASCNKVYEEITSLCPEEKSRIAIITGETPQEVRDGYVKDYQNPNGNIRCLINCMVLTEGVDLPITDTIICARPTANPTLYTQIVGRGTRPYPGKEYCMVLDVKPKSARVLCNTLTIAGVERKRLEKIADELGKEIDADNIDFSEVIELVDEYDQRFKDALNIKLTEFDLISDEIDEFDKMIRETGTVDSFVTELVKTRESDNDSGLWFGPLHSKKDLFLGGYIVNGTTDKNYSFHLSEPNMLSMTVMTARINGIIYEGEIKWEQAIRMIIHICETRCSDFFYKWDESAIRSWKNYPASDAQVFKIKSLYARQKENKEKVPDFKVRPSKYDASIAIDSMLQLPELKEKRSAYALSLKQIEMIREKRKDWEQKKPSKKRDEMIEKLEKEEKSKLSLISGNEKKEDITSFTKLYFGTPLNTVFAINSDNFNATESKATEKQIQYARNLIESLKRKAELVGDLDAFLNEAEYSWQISNVIAVVKKLVYTDKIAWHTGPTVDFSQFLDSAGDRNALQYRIGVSYFEKYI